MGLKRINTTLEALQQAGIRAKRGFPVSKMPHLTASMAGVSIQQMDAFQTTLAVRIYTPLELGGAVCEDLALQAAQALEDVGAEYTIQDCSFDGKLGMFCMKILATFSPEAPEIPEIPDITA